MKWIDLPPLWLIAALGLAYAVGQVLPVPRFGPRAETLGQGLIVLGLGLIALAAAQMLSRQTTVIPHREAQHLVTSGIFALSRNPIYLGDALILTGAVLYWRALLPMLLVPAFMALIQTRFIAAEEARLQTGFGAEFDAYRERTRRWL
ncbi:MAG: isoprenylcysteine carboxylmethyltransferase family protein [Pseudomonadota bacterium]